MICLPMFTLNDLSLLVEGIIGGNFNIDTSIYVINQSSFASLNQHEAISVSVQSFFLLSHYSTISTSI